MFKIIRKPQRVSLGTKYLFKGIQTPFPQRSFSLAALHSENSPVIRSEQSPDMLVDKFVEKLESPNADPRGIKVNMEFFTGFANRQVMKMFSDKGYSTTCIQRKHGTYIRVSKLTEEDKMKAKTDKKKAALEELMHVRVPIDMKDELDAGLVKFENFMDTIGRKMVTSASTSSLYTQKSFGGDPTMREVAIIPRGPISPQMLASRQRLPMSQLKDQVLDLIRENQATVVSGATGSGKSTQLPQYMLDDLGAGQVKRIMVVQPRRISATSLARRVCDERGSTLGQTVGYQVRNDKSLSSSTQILFVTTGILLRRFSGDPTLDGFSHIVMDEVHERSLEGDFCLAILKRVMQVRKDLKLVAMSATFKSSLFTDYLTLDPERPAQSYDVPGVSYPVKVIPLEDILRDTRLRISANDLNQPPRPNAVRTIASAANKMLLKMTSEEYRQVEMEMDRTYADYPPGVRSAMANLHTVFSPNVPTGSRLALAIWEVNAIIQILKRVWSAIEAKQSPKGAVLVFLPGWDDISTIKNALEADHMLNNSCAILPLHSAISPEEQRRVFDSVPEGKTKVVLATNIAETGITISDAVYVIDTGKVKESDYDPDSRIKSLCVKWITKANAKQRAGRAGRVAAGYCFRLYPQSFFDSMPDFPVPEVQRTSLDSVILQVLNLSLSDGIAIQGFLNTFIDPPSQEQVEGSLRGLRDIGAIEQERELLTPLGKVLASLPLEPRDGKMLVYASMFNLLPAALTLVAAREKDLFTIPPVAERTNATIAQRSLAENTNSDSVATINGFHRATTLDGTEFQDFCRKYFISRGNMGFIHQVRNQLFQALSECGFIPYGSSRDSLKFNGVTNDDTAGLARLRALLTASLYPNICKVLIPNSEKRSCKYLVEGGREGTLPLSSTLVPKSPSGLLAASNDWIIYSGLFVRRNLESSNLVPDLLSPTVVDNLTLLIFSGGQLEIKDPEVTMPSMPGKRGRGLPKLSSHTAPNVPSKIKLLVFTTPSNVFRFETDLGSANLILRAREAMNDLLVVQLSQAQASSQRGIMRRSADHEAFIAARENLIKAVFSTLSIKRGPNRPMF